MGIIIRTEEYRSTVKFDQPITIEGKTYNEYVYIGEDGFDTIGSNGNKAERFFKELLFRKHGFVRCRLDGKDAAKEEQDMPEYEDFIYYPEVWSAYHSYFPTKKEIIENAHVDGYSSVKAMCYCGLKGSPDYDKIVSGIKMENAMIENTINDLIAKHNPNSTTIQVQNPTMTSPVQAQTTAASVANNIDTVIAMRSKTNPFIKATQNASEPTASYAYEEPDYNKEPYTSKPLLTQIIEQIKQQSGGKLVAMIKPDDKNILYWVFVYDAVTKKEQHDKCIVVDLDGNVVAPVLKFWYMSDVLKFIDIGPEMLKYYITLVPENIKKLVDGEKFTFEENSEEVLAMAWNKIVSARDIITLNVSKEDKFLIRNTITQYIEIVQDQFNKNAVRFRLDKFDLAIKAFDLVQDSNCTRGVYDSNPDGPAVPITLRFEQGKIPYFVPATNQVVGAA